MSYRVEILDVVFKDMKNIPGSDRKRIIARMERLAENPRPPRAKKLVGEEDTYRIRSGNYRILYEIKDDILLVLVVQVGDRKDVYRSRRPN